MVEEAALRKQLETTVPRTRDAEILARVHWAAYGGAPGGKGAPPCSEAPVRHIDISLDEKRRTGGNPDFENCPWTTFRLVVCQSFFAVPQRFASAI